MSAFSVHSNCSSFVSLKADFEVSYLQYVHNNSTAISCPICAVRLGRFRCFDCWNFIYMDLNDHRKRFDAVYSEEENVEEVIYVQTNWWFSCSELNLLHFLSVSLFHFSFFLLPHHSSVSLCVLNDMAVPGSSPNCDDQPCAGWRGVAAWQMRSSGWPGLKWRWLAAAHVPQLGPALAPEVRAPVGLMSG